MNITLTGSLGNVSKPLAEILIKAGHKLTIISSDAGKKTTIENMGATAAIGSVEDEKFLTQAFKGADIVYTMIPPNFAAPDYRKYLNKVGNIYAAAIKAARVKKVVNLSSIGAHLTEGTGPIAGMHDVEEILNRLDDVAVKHFRAGFFFINFHRNADMIKQMNVLGTNYGADELILMVHPNEIAAAIAREIELPFAGKTVQYVVNDIRTAKDTAAILGASISKPELPWVEFTDEQAYGGMMQAGLPEPIAKMYVEMNGSVRNGKLWEDYFATKATTVGVTKLEEFAKEFAAAF